MQSKTLPLKKTACTDMFSQWLRLQKKLDTALNDGRKRPILSCFGMFVSELLVHDIAH